MADHDTASSRKPPKRTNEACSRCRSKKIKCDVALQCNPSTASCRPCRSVNALCVYKRRDEFEDLRRKVEQYEGILRSLLPPNIDLNTLGAQPMELERLSSSIFLPLTDPEEKALNIHDVSHREVLARNMGVLDSVICRLIPVPILQVHEDLMVGVNLQRIAHGVLATPCLSDPNQWDPMTSSDGYSYLLPRNRETTQIIIDNYFARCQSGSPILDKREFLGLFGAFSTQRAPYNPSILCVIHVVFALGTMVLENDRSLSSLNSLPDWPSHHEFFVRASFFNMHMHVAISSLQALLLIHMYLTLESPERNLWRLVGHITRLAIELDLHRDPAMLLKNMGRPFTADQCERRVRLWSVVFVLDRHTSLLLGRPTMVPDGSTKPPPPNSSIHPPLFKSFYFVAHIQEHITFLYTLDPRGTEVLLRSISVLKAIDEFRDSLPRKYFSYFSGSLNDAAAELSEEEILILLQLGFSRILLSRVVFSLEHAPFNMRQDALKDGTIAAYNVVVLEAKLRDLAAKGVRSPHVQTYAAVMVLLYGFKSLVEEDRVFDHDTVIRTIRLAYDLLPHISVKQDAGGLLFFAQVMECAFNVTIDSVAALTAPYTLMHQPGWAYKVAG